MKWNVPAKTFLLGEYAALRDASAILAVTSPCFTISLQDKKAKSDGLHPESPAGLWWNRQKLNEKTIEWSDPYQGCGGLGASSAQFIGSYLASCLLKNTTTSLKEMLEAYYQCAWNGLGLRPSGYDVIAQTLHGCVYINKQNHQIKTYAWPFSDLSFFLVHTGVKLATHHHLQKATLPENVEHLSKLVDKAKEAMERKNSSVFIACINDYHHELVQLNLVAEHSLELIHKFKQYPEVLAIKGCGALGSDMLLIITSPNQRASLRTRLEGNNKKILATEMELVQEKKNMVDF